MKMQTTLTVVGMKASKGKLDNGTEFDSTKIYVLVDMDDRKGNMLGQGTAEYPIGDSTELEKFRHIPFPFTAAADIEILTTGTQQRMVVTSLTPVKATPKQPA